jgi:hypothetical protein
MDVDLALMAFFKDCHFLILFRLSCFFISEIPQVSQQEARRLYLDKALVFGSGKPSCVVLSRVLQAKEATERQADAEHLPSSQW